MMFPLSHGVMAAGGGAPAPEAYHELVLAGNPVAYWRLGESTGTTTGVDATGNGNDLTYGAGVFFEQPGAITGDPNTAIDFDPSVSNNRAYITAANFPTFPRGSISVEFWVDLSEVGNSIITKGTSRIGSREIDIFTRNASGTPSISFGANGNSLFIVDAPLPAVGTGYHHYVCSWDGLFEGESLQGVKIYIDGQLAGSGFANNTAAEIADYGEQFNIGGQGTYRGNDPIDEVSVYDYELSAQQVLDRYNMGTGGAS